MRSTAQVTDEAKVQRPLLSDEQLKHMAEQTVAQNKDAWYFAEEKIDPSQKSDWWGAIDTAQKEKRRTRHPGEVFVKDRFGERSYPLFETALPQWKKMTQEIVTLIPSLLEETFHAISDAGAEHGPLALGGMYMEFGEFGTKFTTQLGKEMLASPTEEIKRLEALRDSIDDAEFRKGVQEKLDELWAEERPLWTLINDTFGDAYGYLDLRDPEKFLEKLAYESPQVISDMAGLAAIILSSGMAAPVVGKVGGAQRARQFAQFSEKALKILDWTDPASLPFKLGQAGMKRVVGPQSPLMRSPMADETDRKMQEIARGMGIDDPTQELPMSQMNPSEPIKEREMVEALNPLESGKSLRRVEKGYDVGLEQRKDMTARANPAGAGLDAETAGGRALDEIDETKFETRAQAHELYKPLREHGDTTFDPEFGIEARLQVLIDELRGTGEEVHPDAEKAAEILQGRLNTMRTRRAEAIEKGQSLPANAVNEMSLNSLREFRSNFRREYRNSFLSDDAKKVTKIGENSHESRVYNRVTEILDEGIEHLEASGRIPEGSGESIKAGDQLWRERAQLEGTPGGELLFRQKKTQGAKLVDTVLDDASVTTGQLQNIYQILGEDGTRDFKAALLNRIFERAKLTDDISPAVKDRPSPGLLSGALNKVKDGHPPEFLSNMFDPETAEELEELAYFMDGLLPAFKMKTGSQTYRGLVGAAAKRISGGAGLGYGMQRMIEIGNSIMGGGDMELGIMFAVGTIGTMAGAYGVDRVIYSAASRKRILDGLELSPRHKAILDAEMQKYTKTAEAATRLRDSDEGGDE